MNVMITGPKSFGTTKRKSFVEDFDRQIPGPGAYESIRMDRIENPEWPMGTQQQRNSFIEKHRLKLPAPNIYQPNYAVIDVSYSLMKKNPISYSVQKGKKDSKSSESFTPQLKADTSLIKAHCPQYSFGYSIEQDYDNKLPGVGSYQLNQQHERSSLNKYFQQRCRTQNHFGKGRRSLPHGEEGYYPSATKYSTIGFNRTAKYSFPRTERVIKKKNEDPPGKFYDIRPKRKAPNNNRFFDIKAKKRQTILFQPNQNPGPNQYTPSNLDKIPCGVMEHSKRIPPEHIPVVGYPSPDKYIGNQVHQSKKGYSFFKSVREMSLDQKLAPGPGTYEPGSTFRTTVGGAIAKSQQKEKDQTVLVSPGANHYRPKANITRPNAKLTIVFKSDRVDFSKTITGAIGPGQYDLKFDTSKGQAGKIGSSRRPELYSGSTNVLLQSIKPGVGYYDISSPIGQLPKYYTSPKKMTETGYSTFHEKLKQKMIERQRKKQLEQQKEGQLLGKSEGASEDVMTSKNIEKVESQ